MPPIHNSPGTSQGSPGPVHPPPGSVGWLAETVRDGAPVGGDVVNFAGVRQIDASVAPPIAINCPCGRKADNGRGGQARSSRRKASLRAVFRRGVGETFTPGQQHIEQRGTLFQSVT